jgi:serine/threonine protein kinase
MHVLNDLVVFHARVCQARRPEDLFGARAEPTAEEKLRALSRAYREMVAKYHPDKHAGHMAAQYYASEVTAMVNVLYAQAKERVEQGIYGRPDPTSRRAHHGEIKTPRRTYRMVDYLAEGDVSDVYLGEYDGDGGVGQVAIKIARSTSDNDLMLNERDVLLLVKHKSLPVLVETFKTTDGKVGTITRLVEGHDLFAVRKRYPGGVGQEHACWMLERFLGVLGFLHVNGVIHGNIEPGNLLVRPRDHNGFLLDLTFACVRPQRGDTFKGANPDYSAPEVFERRQPIPPSDLYSLGKCMVFLLGGDVERNTFPDGVDGRLRSFLGGFLDPHPLHRTRDAWESWRKLSDLRLSLFGQRRQFLSFNMEP